MLPEWFKRTLLAFAVVTTCINIWVRVAHVPFPINILLVSTIITFAMAFICAYEVWKSPNIKPLEKLLWTIGFLLIGVFVIVPYFIRARKRIHVFTANSTA
jgi:hypothetical protein